jgi:hypothetical protein
MRVVVVSLGSQTRQSSSRFGEHADLTIGGKYDVHAMSVWQGDLFLQVVNDIGYPAWEPAWLFSIEDLSVPQDWICNLFGEDLQIVIGPDFVACDEEHYTDMVELATDSVARFWERIQRIEACSDRKS